jgi:hypothetical protein
MATKRIRPTSRCSAHGRREAGWGLVSVFVTIVFTSVALGSQMLVASYASLGSRRGQDALECRQAALDVLRGPVPASTGGSLAPAAAVTDWNDVVYFEARSGAVLPAGTSPPSGATLISRQWRVGTGQGGERVLEVSAVSVNADRSPRRGMLAVSVVLSRRVD